METQKFKEPRTTSGQTPFHLACAFGHFQMVEKLVDKSKELKIHLNAKDNTRSTAFHIACQKDHSNIAELLIKVLFSKINILAKLLFGQNSKKL